MRGFFDLHDGWDRAVPALCNADIAVSLTGCEGGRPGQGGGLEHDGLFLELYEFLLSMLDDDILMVCDDNLSSR